MKIGKSLVVFSLSVVIGSLSLVAPLPAEAQITPAEGPESMKMRAPAVPGDDQLVLRQPNGCQIRASKSGGCDVIVCKGEESIAIKSARGVQIAKTVAQERAMKMQRAFIEQTVSSGIETTVNTKQLSNEGVTSDAQAQVLTTLNETFKRNVAGILKGVGVEEDGILESSAAGQYMAYVITKTSCRLRQAATKSGAEMSGSVAPGSPGVETSGGTQSQAISAPVVTQNPNTLNPVQRRGGGLD